MVPQVEEGRQDVTQIIRENAGLVVKKRLEEKQKMRQLSKEWKIDNKEWLEEDFGAEDPEQVVIPPGYEDENEYVYFERNTREMAINKRFARNLKDELNLFFSKENRTKSFLYDQNVPVVNEIRLNKAMTKAYCWFELANCYSSQREDQAVREKFETMENRLNEGSKFISHCVSKELGLKYSINLDFKADTFVESLEIFSESMVSTFNSDMLKAKKEQDDSVKSEDFTSGVVKKTRNANMFSVLLRRD